ncbi:MAG: ATP-binding protein, partial [Phormidesmis sp. CAN_BIN36]|nr:ATP-binding protein [Phormidesmis sp. CAN_BIN36]
QRRTAHSALVSQSGMLDTFAPVIRLEPLSRSEILQLLQRLAEIHRHHYDYSQMLSLEELKEFLSVISDRVGADKLLTPGEIVRDFMSVLNILHQNPQLSLGQLLQRSDFQPSRVNIAQAESSGEFAEFTL